MRNFSDIVAQVQTPSALAGKSFLPHISRTFHQRDEISLQIVVEVAVRGPRKAFETRV
jgi:hypothetical protein